MCEQVTKIITNIEISRLDSYKQLNSVSDNSTPHNSFVHLVKPSYNNEDQIDE